MAHCESNQVLIVGGVGKGAGRKAVTLNIDEAANPDVIGVAQRLPFGPGSFNHVNIERLPYTQLTTRTFSEAFNVLSSGGRVSGITGSGANINAIVNALKGGGFVNVRISYGIGRNAGIEFSGIKP